MPWWNRRPESRSEPYDPVLDSEVGVGWRKRSAAVGEALGGISAELARLPWDWGLTDRARERRDARIRRITAELETMLQAPVFYYRDLPQPIEEIRHA
jgi:hypothetical protein